MLPLGAGKRYLVTVLSPGHLQRAIENFPALSRQQVKRDMPIAALEEQGPLGRTGSGLDVF